jgi:hypothetical protein
MNTVRTTIIGVEDWWYEFINVNANLARAEAVARTVGNGMHAGINFVVMLILSLASFVLAWHFDFASTYEGLSGLRNHIIPSLPHWAALSGAIVTAVITVTPTLVEVFTANLAKANIGVIRLFILGVSAFDVITDIPTTKVWIDSWQSSFNALGPVGGWIAYHVAFYLWLAMATIGFQLTLVIFLYLTFIYGRKAFFGMSTAPVKKIDPQVKRVDTQSKEPKEGKVTIIDAA